MADIIRCLKYGNISFRKLAVLSFSGEFLSLETVFFLYSILVQGNQAYIFNIHKFWFGFSPLQIILRLPCSVHIHKSVSFSMHIYLMHLFPGDVAHCRIVFFLFLFFRCHGYRCHTSTDKINPVDS